MNVSDWAVLCGILFVMFGLAWLVTFARAGADDKDPAKFNRMMDQRHRGAGWSALVALVLTCLFAVISFAT